MKTTLWICGLLVMALSSGCGNVEPKEPDHAGNVTAPNDDGSDKPDGHRAEKPGAPVVIDGKVEATRATLKVGFVSDATDASIDVWGVDGLTVTSMAITQGGQAVSQSRFAKGEYVDVAVTFTAPTTTRSNLAIRVHGRFGAKTLDRVQSFTVNGDLPSATPAPGEVKVGPDGTPVRVMKAQ